MFTRDGPFLGSFVSQRLEQMHYTTKYLAIRTGQRGGIKLDRLVFFLAGSAAMAKAGNPLSKGTGNATEITLTMRCMKYLTA